ncbi:MAG: ferritin-like domain-containing protein [Propionibacteriales bacterium]|nr:ferritin-like domain-containing protein [Propionibacteriales bacterium]
MTDTWDPAETPATPDVSPGVVDLLGMLAYGELRAFERLAEDAGKAPDLAAELAVVRLAATQVDDYRRIEARLAELGSDAMAAMGPFRDAIDGYHDHTVPRTWLEGLVKAYVGDGLAADFAAEVAQFCDEDTRTLVEAVTDDEALTGFIPPTVKAAIEADPTVGGRLALWGRRLVGEAMSQAQRVATDRADLTDLIAGTPGDPNHDLAAISAMFSRLVLQHSRRMAALGLSA